MQQSHSQFHGSQSISTHTHHDIFSDHKEIYGQTLLQLLIAYWIDMPTIIHRDHHRMLELRKYIRSQPMNLLSPMAIQQFLEGANVSYFHLFNPSLMTSFYV
jgi:hypothetical protein